MRHTTRDAKTRVMRNYTDAQSIPLSYRVWYTHLDQRDDQMLPSSGDRDQEINAVAHTHAHTHALIAVIKGCV